MEACSPLVGKGGQHPVSVWESGLASVVIPAYNAERTICATVKSVLGQTYRPIEVIVVDDGSQDHTSDAVARFTGSVQLLRGPNSGAAAARNRGIDNAHGEFVAFLDADDLWESDKLARQIAFLNGHPEIGAVQSGARFVDDEMRTLEVQRCVVGGDALADALRFRNLPAFPSALVIRHTCLKDLGGFDTSLVILEDWDMAIRAARHCRLASLAEPLVLYRVHGGNRSRNIDIHITPGLSVLRRLYRQRDLPSSIARDRREIYATFYRMLAGGYFRARRPGAFARWALRALVTDPAQILYMLALPARFVRRKRSAR